MTDYYLRTLSQSGGIRIIAGTMSHLAREVCSLQQASATASIALGRGLAGGALLGALLKSGQRVALKFEGNGPMRKMIIEADAAGAVRGYAADPSAEAGPLNGRWDVPGILGRAGFLTVTKDLGMKEPYRGMIQLQSSEIGDDLAYYLTESEQTPSAVGLGTTLAADGSIATCGGFLIQALPDVDDREIAAVMESIAALPPLADILDSEGPEGLPRHLFGDIPFTILEHRELYFRCSCSPQKVTQALLTLPPGELADMAHNDQGAEVACEFCRQKYVITAEELLALIP